MNSGHSFAAATAPLQENYALKLGLLAYEYSNPSTCFISTAKDPSLCA